MLNALTGAGYASAIQQFNQANENDEKEANKGSRKLDPSNPELQTLTDPNQPRVISDNDVSRMENTLLEAREVNRLLTTPEGRKELLAKTPTGTENLTEAAKKVVEQEQLKGIDNSQSYSGVVSFGRNPNQEYHVWRHIEKETPLNKEEVKN